jgi:hypothetical protein
MQISTFLKYFQKKLARHEKVWVQCVADYNSTEKFMKETGGPAFPAQQIVVNEQGQITGFAVDADGMTLRDYFAAKAMQALLNSDEWRESLGESDASKFTAFSAYAMADAMMEARKE